MNTRALFISAPASGQGKTTVTAALARHYRNRGLQVRVFKTGPDFLDPMIHEVASGNPVYQLPLGMASADHCLSLLTDAASVCDIILIEGAMGLYDGEPSSADLAKLFGIPVLLLINAQAMAQTFGALAHGLASYRSDTVIAGVIANNVASDSHAALLQNSLPADLRWYGGLPKLSPNQQLPSRHLGLVQASEIEHLDALLDDISQHLFANTLNILPEVIELAASPTVATTPQLLSGVRVAVARDVAFSFCYRANLDVLRKLGASIVFTSPLSDSTLPACDALYLPGGYPELHLQTLSNNSSYLQDIRQHILAGKPCLAECGGMLYLLEQLADSAGLTQAMAGVISGHAKLQKKLANLSICEAELPEGVLTAHSFHHSVAQIDAPVIANSRGKRGKSEAVYRIQRMTASYLHFYFPSNPEAIARLLTP